MIIAMAVLIPVIWTLPILFGYRNQPVEPETRQFLGWMRSDDFHRYGSFIDQTRRTTAFVYTDFSSVEPQSPRMIAVYFFVLGLIGKWIPLSAATLWLLSRFIISWLFIWLLFRFIQKWTDDKTLQNTALIFILFSCGFEMFARYGNLHYPRIKNSWMDGFSTFCSFHNPLKIAGICTVIALFLVLDSYLNTQKIRYLGGASALILLAWMIHPNSAIPGYTGVLFLGLVIPRQKGFKSLFTRWCQLAPLIAPVLVILAYIVWMRTDATTANIIRQYSLKFLTEPFKYYPIRYGVILPLAVPGMIWSLNSRSNLTIMMIGWLIGGEFFAHFAKMSGLLFQHMIHLPMALFAAVAFCRLLSVSKTVKMWSMVLLIALFGVQHLATISKVIKQTQNDVWPTSLYWTPSEITVAAKLSNEPAGNVISTRDSGNKIAWLAQKHVLLGHWGTTPYKGKKEGELKRFFDSNAPLSEKQRILDEYSIAYVWYGPRESALGPIDSRLELTQIMTAPNIIVYRTKLQSRQIELLSKPDSLPNHEMVP